MNFSAAPTLLRFVAPNRARSAKVQFRECFQRSLRSCLRRGFGLEEAFGMIWMETWEEIPLNDQEQAEIYNELIQWAKNTRI